MAMVEVQESTQNRDQVSEAYAVNLAPGVSIDSLFPQYPQFEAASAYLEVQNNLTQPQKDAILLTAVGMSVKHDETVQEFVNALDAFQAGQNSYEAKQKDELSNHYREVTKLYDNNPDLQQQADKIAKSWSNIYTQPITGQEVFAGLCDMGVVTLPDFRKLSSKKKVAIMAVILGVTLLACVGGQETAANSSYEFTFNKNITVNSEVLPITAPMHGILSDANGQLIDSSGQVITPVPQDGKFLYSGAMPTNNEFRFAKIEIGEETVTVFQQVEDGDPTLMMFVSAPNENGAYVLIDQYNQVSDYTISVNGNKIILNDSSTGLHYLITAATFTEGLATPSVIESPTPAIDQMNNSYPVYDVSFKSTDLLPTVTYQVKTATPAATETPVPTESSAPTIDPNAPEGWQGEKDAQGNYILRERAQSGEEIVKTWVEYKSSTGEILWNGWAQAKTPNMGIPLLDWPPANNVEGYENDIAPMRLFCGAKVDTCTQLSSLDHKGVIDKNFNERFVSALRPILYEQYYGYKPGQGDLWEFEKSLQNGDIDYDFLANGDTLTWSPSPDHGTIGIIQDWDAMSDVKEVSLGSFNLRIRIEGISESGDLIYTISVDKLSSSDEISYMLFGGVGTIMEKTESLEDIVYHSTKIGSDGNPYVIINQR